jgi:hypothetical protein
MHVRRKGMPHRKVHVVFYIDNKNLLSMDAVFSQSQYWEAQDRVDTLNSYKWIKKAWCISPEMKTIDLEIPLSHHLSK